MQDQDVEKERMRITEQTGGQGGGQGLNGEERYACVTYASCVRVDERSRPVRDHFVRGLVRTESAGDCVECVESSSTSCMDDQPSCRVCGGDG